MNLGLLKNSYQYLLLIFEDFDYSDNIFEGYNDILNLMNNLNLPEINKKIFHLILLNIFNDIILENNSKYFNNGKPNNNFFTENKNTFTTYIESIIYKEYEKKQNSIFIKIYMISFIKIYIFYISEVYSNKNVFEKFNGLKDIDYISFITNNQDYVPFVKYFIKCIKYHLNDSFTSLSTYDYDYFGLSGIKDNYLTINNQYIFHPLEIICIDDKEKYFQLRVLYQNELNDNFMNEEITQQMINLENNNEKIFFEFILNEILCFYFNKNSSNNIIDNINNIINWCIESITKNNIKKILKSFKNFEGKMNCFSDKETTLIIFCLIFYININEDEKENIINNRKEDILKYLNKTSKKSLISLLSEFLALSIIFTQSLIENNSQKCLDNMKKIKNIVLNCEEIMNNLYEKSNIFILLNILKKNFIQNDDENYEKIIEFLIQSLNNDKYMQEYKLLISNSLNYTKIDKIRVEINEL